MGFNSAFKGLKVVRWAVQVAQLGELLAECRCFSHKKLFSQFAALRVYMLFSYICKHFY